MTGAEIKLDFDTLINEQYTDQWLPVDLNRFFATSVIQITGRLIDDFQASASNINKILPLLIPITVNPVSNLINISHTGSLLPNYKQVILMDNFVFTVGASTKTNIQPAKPVIYNTRSGIYSRGTYRYPKYRLTSGLITIESGGIACTSVDVWYVTEPFLIDTSDNTTNVPYSYEMIQMIIKGAMVEALKSISDFNFAGQDQQVVTSQE